MVQRSGHASNAAGPPLSRRPAARVRRRGAAALMVARRVFFLMDRNSTRPWIARARVYADSLLPRGCCNHRVGEDHLLLAPLFVTHGIIAFATLQG
ncbi:hypothetical protein MRX96_018930 [Rhipicephalus microplus]